jgi:hypothetical protein
MPGLVLTRTQAVVRSLTQDARRKTQDARLLVRERRPWALLRELLLLNKPMQHRRRYSSTGFRAKGYSENMKKVINDFHCGEADDRVAELSCGYDQNVGPPGAAGLPRMWRCARGQRSPNGLPMERSSTMSSFGLVGKLRSMRAINGPPNYRARKVA